jgi:hypothetical protein
VSGIAIRTNQSTPEGTLKFEVNSLSHISTFETDTKILSDQELNQALNALTQQFVGLTLEKSQDGKIIKVKYAKLDDPVKHYHPEGNLRLTKMSNGEWKISGDKWNCAAEYKKVTEKVLLNYKEAGVKIAFARNGYQVSPNKREDEKIVMYARRY